MDPAAGRGPGVRAGRHAAVLAARPHRPRRPGRGGHPAGGVREHPGPDAARAGRPRADRPAAAAPLGQPGAGRRRVRRGAQPRRSPRGRTPTGCCCRPTTRAGPRWSSPTRSARMSRCCAPRCCPACSGSWPATSAAASPTSRCSRSAWSSGRGPAPRPRRRSCGGPRADGGGAGHAGGRAAGPAAADRRRAGGRPRAGGLVGTGPPGAWPDAIEAARTVLRVSRVPLDVRADQHAPWHPGRCAAIYVQVRSDDADGPPREWLAGHAGELHPRVVQAFGLPDRTCAMELDLSVMFTAAEGVGAVQAPQLSAYPVATQDVALVVDAAVPAAAVEAALVAGRGRGRAAGGRPAVRRLHRSAGRRGPQVAGVHAAVPRPRPHADRRGDHRGPGRGGRRGRPPRRRGPAQRVMRSFARFVRLPLRQMATFGHYMITEDCSTALSRRAT